MVQRFLKIASISDPKTGKNGEYLVVKFEPRYMLNDGTPVGSALSEGTRVLFGAHKGPNGEDFKGDGLFKDVIDGKIKVGSLIEGEITRVKTTPYLIDGSDREVTSYTCVLFAHEDVREHVNKQLKSAYACMIDGDFITAPNQCNKPVGAPVHKMAEAL